MTAAPPKPWETSTGVSNAGNSSSSALSSSAIDVPSSGITKHPNNPHIARQPGPSATSVPSSANSAGDAVNSNSNSNSSSSAATATNNAGSSSSSLLNPAASASAVSPYTSSYGSMYSPYGAGMYGGGMYGGGMYGGTGMYGGGMLPFGGAALGPMSYMQSSVDTVGRFSQMLQMASSALHMTFQSLVQFAGGVAQMTREFGGFFSLAMLWKWIRKVLKKIRNLILWLLRRPIPSDSSNKSRNNGELEALFSRASGKSGENSASSAAGGIANGQNNSQHSPDWITLGFYVFGSLWLLQWIYRAVKSDVGRQPGTAQNAVPFMQQGYGMQPMGMYGAGMAPGYGYGGYAQPISLTQTQPAVGDANAAPGSGDSTVSQT